MGATTSDLDVTEHAEASNDSVKTVAGSLVISVRPNPGGAAS
jgi:hypothetical protein